MTSEKMRRGAGGIKLTACVALVASLFVSSMLLGCGGGGGDAPTVPVPATDTPPTTSLAISSFSPAATEIGGLVTVIGTDLGTVQSVKVGGLSASFTIDSGSQLRFTVPAGSSSGRISLSVGGRIVISATDLTVNAIAQVSGITPANVSSGGRVTVSGTSLDQVKRAQLGATALVIVSQSPATLVLDVPVGATSDFLTLLGVDDVARTSAERITVINSLSVTAIAPSIALRGLALQFSGNGLDRVTTARFTGSATDAMIAAQATNSGLTVVVPADAATGPVTLTTKDGETVSTAPLTVVAAISVDSTRSWLVAAGAPLVLMGSGFEEVSAVLIGTFSAAISSRTSNQLTIDLPPNVVCGPLTLQSNSQPAVAAGNVVVGAGCTIRNAGVEFAQVLSQNASDSYERLVPGRPAQVRVFVVSDVGGTVAPVVQLTATQGTTLLGTLTLNGPTMLPILANGATLPNRSRYDPTFPYTASLPANWLVSGLQIRIDVDPQQRQGAASSTQLSPVVGNTSRIDLVLVPLVSGSNVPQMPLVADVVDELVRRMPFDRSRITVSIRAPYNLTASTDGVDTQADWSDVLAELDRLRRSEAPGRHYYGMVSPVVSSGIAGIGYVNRVGNNAASLASVGWDASRASWRRTMIHELGHNFSRPHAPCGGPTNPDANFPYSNGSVSPTPLFDAVADTVVSPAGLYDVMGYCNGVWFSDYNFREVQRFVEAQPIAIGSALLKTALEEGQILNVPDMELLQIDGRLRGAVLGRVVVQAMRGPAPNAALPLADGGLWVLRLVRPDASAVDVPFEPMVVDHIDDELHFHVALPHPGTLARLDVIRDGVRITSTADQASSPSPADPLNKAKSVEALAQTVDWIEKPGRLDVRWQVALAPSLGVTWIAPDGQRQVLALDVRGGVASIALPQLPVGGVFEFSLVAGLNARSVQVAR